MATLLINQAPQIIASGSAGTATQVNNASVFTVAPQNQDITVTAMSAGVPLPGYDGVTIPGTVQMPFPIVSNNWGGNNASILNQSSTASANALVGFFGLTNPPSPTLSISNSYQTISQFKSIGGPSSSAPSTIQLQAAGNAATAVMLFGNGNLPQMYVLNYTGSIPPAFNNLPAGVLNTVAGNNKSISANFFGNYLFLVNVSMAASSSDVQVRLLSN